VLFIADYARGALALPQFAEEVIALSPGEQIDPAESRRHGQPGQAQQGG